MRAGAAIRVIGTLAFTLAGWQIGSVIGDGAAQSRNAVLGIGIGAATGFALAPYVVGRPYLWLRRLASRTPVDALLAGMVGLILGLIVAALLAFPLSFLPWWFGRIMPAATAAACAYLGVSLMGMRHRELSHVLRLPRSQDEKPAGIEFLLDTSAIIDGRIADISQSGFLYGTLVVPRFILSELQRIADSADPLRRTRGRRGLEILNRLQKEPNTPLVISDADPRDVADVDGKLVRLAQQDASLVITNDFNLNRIAELQGVRVLNINQLANAVKPIVLPGEEMQVHIIQEGREYNQGLAYLDDGTMIVVENGIKYLDRDTDVVVTRVLQTVAGRMIFAQPKLNAEP